MFEELECDKDTAFESFIIKMNQSFNNEVDMYGDIQKAGESQLKVLEFGVPIPFEFVADEEKMTKVRSMYRVNTDIPGAIELVHPNKFLPSKYHHLLLHLTLLLIRYRLAASGGVPPHTDHPN